MKRSEKVEVLIPAIEILAAFRQSYRTALREGFTNKAGEVSRYLAQLEGIDSTDFRYATWKVVVEKEYPDYNPRD